MLHVINDPTVFRGFLGPLLAGQHIAAPVLCMHLHMATCDVDRKLRFETKDACTDDQLATDACVVLTG